ncbi:hypothetical protein AA0112_g7954 [Alternaria arborescens]|nr:hypothetical protein AA0112_g7954 [Alternaria arborescens]
MVYLAKVDDALSTTVTGLKWFKIYEDGMDANGEWAVTRLYNNKGLVDFVLPSCIPSGQYLLRAELIALHAASNYPGAQLYMECAQINVTGGGTASPATVSFPGAYKATDPGIKFQLYWPKPTSYTIPGPRPFTCSAKISSAQLPHQQSQLHIHTPQTPTTSAYPADSRPITLAIAKYTPYTIEYCYFGKFWPDSTHTRTVLLDMHDEHPHPLLAQVPLTLSPFLSLPTSVPLPYSYVTLPSTLPPSILSQQQQDGSSASKPAYVMSSSGTSAHPDQILTSCVALQEHLSKLEADARKTLAQWEERRQKEDLAEKRRVAPGWLDSGVHILKPEESGGGAKKEDQAPVQNLMDLDPQAESKAKEGEELDRVFGGLQV